MRLWSVFTRKGRLHLARYRRIASTLVAYGFGEVVHQSGVGKVLRLLQGRRRRSKRDAERPHHEYGTWERLRMVIEELGPTFIKLGQILSNRPDLVPPELQVELQKLRENVPPYPTEQAIGLLETELGAPLSELFREFERTPLAAASIAQVHRAVLPTGERVAVKVQRPGLRTLVAVDIQILSELAELAERHIPATRYFGVRKIVTEFRKAMDQELDFRREAASIERFTDQFSDDDRLKVPRVYRSHSTDCVLSMEFIEGTPLAELLGEQPRESAEGKRVAELGAELTLKQIFRYGFFHADPHVGNIVILEDGRLCYLDFGLTGSLISRDLEVISDMLVSILAEDEQKAARAVVRLAGSRNYEIARSIEREIAVLIDRFRTARAGDFSFTGLLSEVVTILVDKDLYLPADLFLLVKSLITIEGVTTALDPEFDFASHVEPFAKELLRERYDPQRVATKLAATAGDWAEILQSFPADYYKLVDTVASGKVRITLDEESIKPLHRTVLQASSALVFALVLGSLIIGSAVMVHSKVPPLWHEIPVIGILGFLAAGLIGFWLLIKIIRNGGL
jgi:ubiquinone biosynthesis protein